MPYARQIIFVLLCICSSSFSLETVTQNSTQVKPIKINPIHEPNISQKALDQIKAEQLRQKILLFFQHIGQEKR